MRRAQRSTHRVLWPLLALAVGFGLVMALWLRAPFPGEAPAPTQERPR